MALSVTRVGDAARVDHWVKGMGIHQVDITTSTGGGSTDYSSGFDLNGIAAKLGFRVIFAVINAVGYTAAGVFLPLLFWNYDSVTGKLRVADATSEAHGAALIDAGGKIRAVIIGV